jgi:hypothetical protein
MPTTSAAMYVVAIYGDDMAFDRVSNRQRATREATDLISANQVNANDDVYDMALAA